MYWQQRSCGVLLHPTSLPSPYGIGDLGPQAYKFVDMLVEAKQKYWQILPLNYPGAGNSPYNPLSAFAGSPWLISPDLLREMGLVTQEEIQYLGHDESSKIDYTKVEWKKQQLLNLACCRLNKSDMLKDEIERFKEHNANWLNPFLHYLLARQRNRDLTWNEWTEDSIDINSDVYKRDFNIELLIQFLFQYQWQNLKNYANQKGIKIIGDLPIYVSYDCADVYHNRRLFQLDDKGISSFVAGVPPDIFTEDGQLWGNPLYDWETLKAENYSWWFQRIRHIFEQVDVLRIDHFIGFIRFWAVPAGEETARDGGWREGPGADFFYALRNELGELPIIAEDLGVVTPKVTEVKDIFGFPGMIILQFSFGEKSEAPNEYPVNSVVYTGTHDNVPVLSWYRDALTEHADDIIRMNEYLAKSGLRFKYEIREDNVAYDFIETAYSAPSYLAILPMQDVLGLGEEAIMNVPGTALGNWEWRMTSLESFANKIPMLRELAEKYNR
jgi:4-alpha-glucanotransferase